MKVIMAKGLVSEMVRGCVALAAVACVGVAAGCSNTLPGTPSAQPPHETRPPTLTQGDLNKLLLSDNEVSDIVGGPSLQTSQNYSEILGPKSETMSDNSCAETAFNTMWTACNGSGYTGVEGRRIGREGDTDSYLVDQGVVSFLDPGAARRFLDRTVQGWDHCAAVRFSVTDPGPPPSTDTYILGNSWQVR